MLLWTSLKSEGSTIFNEKIYEIKNHVLNSDAKNICGKLIALKCNQWIQCAIKDSNVNQLPGLWIYFPINLYFDRYAIIYWTWHMAI